MPQNCKSSILQVFQETHFPLKGGFQHENSYSDEQLLRGVHLSPLETNTWGSSLRPAAASTWGSSLHPAADAAYAVSPPSSPKSKGTSMVHCYQSLNNKSKENSIKNSFLRKHKQELSKVSQSSTKKKPQKTQIKRTHLKSTWLPKCQER